MTHHTAGRWHLLDTVRGITFISMVLYHFSYDVFVVYGYRPNWPYELMARVWQQSICWTFILISGISFHLSKSNWKRGILINALGFAVTFVTILFMPSETIWFGILNLIGIATLLTEFLRPALDRIPPTAGLIFSFLLFLITRQVPQGYIAFGARRFFQLPSGLYRWFIGAWFGFPPQNFYSSDYFAVIPWLFLFLTGYYLFFFLKNSQLEEQMQRGKVPCLTRIGQKTLWGYVIHQPICMLICILLFDVFQ